VVGDQWMASRDTLDVWFDSGSVFHLLLAGNLSFPADLYLEGVDQYRGWFQSSLICSMGRLGTPPYKAVLTHGFAVDQHGKKMSKSLGNVISPFEVADKYGIDVLRLWVATSNYREEMAIGDEILKRTSDIYRRIRNTLRFLISNLFDFNLEHIMPVSKMALLDRYFLYRVAKMQANTRAAYDCYDFDTVARSIVDFCVNELGSDYLDIIKDRLYTAHAGSQARLSCQTTLYYVLLSLIHQLVPLLPFTAEDAWQHFHLKSSDSILLNQWPDLNSFIELMNKDELEVCAQVLNLKKEIQPKLEALRQQGIIGSALEAKVLLTLPAHHRLVDWSLELKFIFLVSAVDIVIDHNSQQIIFEVQALVDVEKCQRCWHRVSELEQDCCPRCMLNMTLPGEFRHYG
jgi:isoleucyl-tRNA synthetase